MTELTLSRSTLPAASPYPPKFPPKRVLDATGRVQPVGNLPDMLGSDAEIAGDFAEESVDSARRAQFRRDTFKVVRQIEPSNVNEAYASRTFASREFCVPLERQARSPQGQRIVQVRNELGLNQEDFAAAIGIDQGTISKWQGGKATPGPHSYALLAALTKKVELRDLLLRDGGESARLAYETMIRHRAGRKGEPDHPTRSEALDVDLLAFVITTIMGGLRKRKLQLPDSKLAEMIALCYDFCCRTHSRDPDIVERFLRVA